MLNSRMRIILQELLGASSPLTSEYLAKVASVTSRTIRHDMRMLEEAVAGHGARIESMRGTGYLLKIIDKEKFKNFLTDVAEIDSRHGRIIPLYPEDRVRYMIRRLLLTNHYLKLEDLADELFVSRSTVQMDFKAVKKIFRSNGIEIVSKPNYGIKIKGDEKKLRFMLSEYLFNCRDDIHRLITEFPFLPSREIAGIQRIILEKMGRYGLVMTDIALTNLIVHIAISCARIRNKNYVSMPSVEEKEIMNKREYKIAEEIVRQLEKEIQVKFPPQEIAYITLHLLGNRLFHEDRTDQEEVKSLLDGPPGELAKEIIRRVEEKMHLGIAGDRKLAISLVLHLEPAINRHRFGMNLRNPLLEDIKTNYPLAFEAGVIASTVIQERLGIKIEESEIGYLAIHFGAAIERRKRPSPRKRCLIICASGAGSAYLLMYKIKEAFGSKIEIVDTTGYYNRKTFPFGEIDFIISTIPIREPMNVPVIQVNTILGEGDVRKIARFLSERDGNPLEKYSGKDLIFLQKSFAAKEEVISFLCEKLKERGMIPDGFFDSVMEREEIAPTCFGNLVAIPHPMVPQTDTTFWSVCTLKKPIQWSDKRVQLVFLLSVQKKNAKDLQEMYKILIRVLDDPAIVQQLVKADTYEAFASVFYDAFVKETPGA
ncbi:BglG family transcription antiterminator [Caldibacillus debilis]|uniref:BglG family transcription antiterminator n=1 Tax=Caldibacillus debilis TaxID=301148 RepID=UPI000E38EF83|nr:BglG family transcription antiterminator [Caldibacillus debilis]REJ31168.1 MAG: PTS fructose transporter subunit IIA [Caldibacillus debilis]